MMNDEAAPKSRPDARQRLRQLHAEDSSGCGAPVTAENVGRLAESRDFRDFVLVLAEQAPEPWATQLYRIAQSGRLAA